MNANPSELVSAEEHTDVVHETELMELGDVSDVTKGSLGGPHPDGGSGWQFS